MLILTHIKSLAGGIRIPFVNSNLHFVKITCFRGHEEQRQDGRYHHVTDGSFNWSFYAMSSKDTEYIMVKACLKGDANAQEQLYYAYTNRMYAICLRYCGNTEDAKDILQEGFIKVYGSLPRFEYRGSLEGWIKRIMINTAIEFHRKRARMISTEEIEDNHFNRFTDYDYRKLEMEDILNNLAKLPEGYRLVFNMYVVEGYKHVEIAEKLGITVGTSKSQLNKARKKLQKLLSDYADQEYRN